MTSKQTVVHNEWVSDVQKLIHCTMHTKETWQFIEHIGSTIVDVKPACLIGISSHEAVWKAFC